MIEIKKPTPPRKYYTAFVMYCQDSISGETLQLHCTHKYLGEQDDNAMSAAYNMINKHFEKETQWPLAVFNERVWFFDHKLYRVQPVEKGKVLAVSVLRSYIHKSAFFPHLREELDQFRADDYPEYTPHITIENYPSISGQFQCYAIMSGEEILTYWRNPQWARAEKAAQKRMENLNPGQALIAPSGLPKERKHLKLMD